MQKLNSLYVGLILIGLTTVAAQDAPFRVDPNTDFSKFKTYKWDRSKNSEPATSTFDTQVSEAVDAELAKKNLKQSEDNADLLICYHSNFGTKQIKRYTMYGGESTYSWTIKTGEVGIDMIDSSTKGLVWHNTADINPKTRSADIQKTVSKLLKDYPPKNK
jgi:hypothetical protein